jgi:putative selenium metabolism hydrolase
VKLSEERKHQLLEDCREMIRRPALSGQEGKKAEFIESAMKALGFDEVFVDAMGNVIGRIHLGKGGVRILLEGHMDHVDIPDLSKWTHDPYGAEVEDGRLYGRATTDMTGNLAAMIHAASHVKKDFGDLLDGEILVAGVVHEECFEGVASELVGEAFKPDCVVIGEPSSLTLKRGQRGRAEVVVETYGKSAHSSDPSVGLNAVKKMAKLLLAIEERFVPKTHPVLGKGILEVTDIISNPYPGASVIPERCTATFDRRLLVGETKDVVLAQVREILDAEMAKDPEMKASVGLAVGEDRCYTGAPIRAERFAPAWLFDENHPVVQSALAGLRSVGQEPALSHYYFCTNGSYYAGKAGIPTIGYGGSLETLAHVVDEYIEVNQLNLACEGYAGIIRAILAARGCGRA